MCVAHSGDVLSGRAVLLREHRFVDQLSATLPTRKQNLKPTAGVWQFISIQVVQQNKPAKSIFFMLFLAGVWELKIGGNLKFFADLTLMSITDTVNLYVKINFNLTPSKISVVYYFRLMLNSRGRWCACRGWRRWSCRRAPWRTRRARRWSSRGSSPGTGTCPLCMLGPEK